MNDRPTSEHLERFQDLLCSTFGFQFGPDKTDWLSRLLSRRCEHLQLNFDGYLQMLKDAEAPEWQALVQLVTVGETFFFRHEEQLSAYSHVLRTLLEKSRKVGRPLRVLSAGCSTGEEPYSLVMLSKEVGAEDREVEFHAFDVNLESLSRARAGSFSEWALRATPPEVRSRWFLLDRKRFILSSEITDRVRFYQSNLLQGEMSEWRHLEFDIIFCRNVLMYFRPDKARVALESLDAVLAPGGYLFLGHAETLRGLLDGFELLNSHNSFFYRRPFEPGPTGALEHERASPRNEGGLRNDWVEAIEASSGRIRNLGESVPPSGPSSNRPSSDSLILRVRELQEQERYAEALELLDSEEDSVSNEAESLLIRSVLLVHLSDFEAAERCCRQLLLSGRFVARSHYILALCYEGKGDFGDAAAEHRAALRLDPSFAMPYLHLGLLARRAQDFPAARRSLESALVLLRQEDRDGLRLFGGGFGREALLELCRNELGLCGGVR